MKTSIVKEFLQRRTRTTAFTGLPLLILSILFLVLLFVFLDIVEDVVTSEQIVHMDLAASAFLAMLRTPFLNSLFLFITEIGSLTSIIYISSAAVFSFFFFFGKNYIPSFLLVLTGTAGTITLLKEIIARERPLATVAFYAEKLFSFPSGHAGTAVAVFGFIAYVCIRNTHSFLFRFLSVFGAVLLIGLIGFSRLYLGVHYISDVIGGYLIGLLWLIIGICMTELFIKFFSKK